MASYRHLIDKAERTLSNSKFVVKLSVLLRNRLVRIIAYSLVKDHTVENSGELLLISKISHLLKTVIDVGANKGEWSEMVLNKCSSSLERLILAEPGKTAFSIIQEKFKGDNRFTLLNIGLSDDDGMLVFNEEENASETSCFLPNASTAQSENYTVVRKLDSILKELNVDFVDFLKIDCEGFDFKVIKGASEHIKSHKIGIIQFEYNTMWIEAGSTLKATFDFLKSFNYEVYLLNDKGLAGYDVDYYKEFFGYSNFVAVSPEWKKNVVDIICNRNKKRSKESMVY
jgi:FkbM family methyltransferase